MERCKCFWAIFFFLLTFLLGGPASIVIAAKPVPPATPIVITVTRSLDFGGCEMVPNTTYVVAAAENPGVSGCQFSVSGRFDVTGEPNEKVTISVTRSIPITNGTDSITVTSSVSPSGGNIKFDATGNLVIWVGGSLKIPIGGVATYGLFTTSTILSVVY